MISLPPDITLHKEPVGDGWIYRFRHNQLGELGRLLLRQLPNGQCHIAAEVAGEASDPMTRQRAEVFQPLSKTIIQHMEASLGVSSQPAHQPYASPVETEQVECELTPCPRCNQPVAMLVFTEARERADFEDYARKMHHRCVELDVPAWIIGEQLGPRSPTWVLKIWPEREPLRTLTPEAFNAGLEHLVEAHCR